MKSNTFAFVFLFLTFLMFTCASNSEDLEKEIFLTAYIKGINLAEAEGRLVFKKERFVIELSAYTVGIFSIISNWKQNVSSEGFYEKSYLRSYYYKSEDKRKNKRGHMYISFKKGFPEIESAQPDPREDIRRKKFKPLELLNTFDPVIGILNVGLNGHCKNISAVFDGKRKYLIKSKFVLKERIESNNFFEKSFNSIKCKFDIEKIAGYTEKELKKYPSNGNIWFKEVKDFGLYFPAKIEINSSWGSFISLIKEREIYSESNNL